MNTAGQIVGLTGHQGLTVDTEQLIHEALFELLKRRNRRFRGVCSLAEGADQIFADVVLALDSELIAVIPSKRYDETFTRPASLAHYRRLLTAAVEVIQLAHKQPSEEAFFAAGRRVVDLSDAVIAVWDGSPPGGRGGTADVVAYATETGKAVEIVWPRGAHRCTDG